MAELSLYVGERRKVTIVVTIKDVDEFFIENAKYKLLLANETVDEGALLVKEHEMSLMVAPAEAGVYTLVAYFSIANEDIIRKHTISVRRGS